MRKRKPKTILEKIYKAAAKPVKWFGDKPTMCDICKDPITTFFVDGRTKMGPWGNMDRKCFVQYGVGVGTGLGQAYELQSNGEWHKVQG